MGDESGFGRVKGGSSLGSAPRPFSGLLAAAHSSLGSTPPAHEVTQGGVAVLPVLGLASHGIAVFAICDSCGTVTEFEDKVVAGRFGRLGKAAGFDAG